MIMRLFERILGRTQEEDDVIMEDEEFERLFVYEEGGIFVQAYEGEQARKEYDG
jgi:hypothetical protein